MNISILCTERSHPVIDSLIGWAEDINQKGHKAELIYDKKELKGGDLLFLVSCGQIIQETERQRYKNTLVLHASDLPRGRGWSPHIWQLLNGENEITVTLLEASEPVDTGAIWLKTSFKLEGHELLPEINEKLFKEELFLMTKAVEEFSRITPTEQDDIPCTYFPKRTPENSRLDPNKTIAEQFDLLRVVDYQRYPAFFDYRGKRYLLKIEKIEDEI